MRRALLLVLLAGCDAPIGAPDGGGDAGATVEDAGIDAALRDGGDADAGPLDAGPRGRVIYPFDRRHSPITEDVAAGLRGIRAREPAMQDDVFAKIGASATASTSFLHCFAGSNVQLDGRDVLRGTIDHFLAGDASGTDPFTRDSLCATPGWHAGRALEGDPAPVDQELDAIVPRFAVVMYGTNDVGIVTVERYGQNMLDLVDALADRGVIPLMTSVMPRDDDPIADARVPIFNLAVRGIAQGRGVPFVDFHRELVLLPDHGIGADGVHPTTYLEGGLQAPCVFTPEGLTAGYDVRNLITIEQLDRVRRVVLAGEPAPEADAPRMQGDGSPTDPFAIEALPFTDLRSTLFSEHRRIDRYDGCGADQDESGPELLYRLVLDDVSRVRAWVISRPGVDVDIHLLDETGTAAGCLARDHRELTADLPAGTYHFAIDTFVDAEGVELAGEYLLLVTTE